MWIVLGTKESTKRVAGGVKLERLCTECGETATFYEKEVTSTFRLYFIDVFDYRRHRVMSCGCCGVSYATDEIGVGQTTMGSGSSEPSLGEQLDRAAQRLGGYIDRAASAVETGVSNVLSEARGRGSSAPPREPPPDEATEDPLADDLEARFRELEKKVRVRTD